MMSILKNRKYFICHSQWAGGNYVIHTYYTYAICILITIPDERNHNVWVSRDRCPQSRQINMVKRSIFPHSLNVLSIIHIVFLDTDTDKLIIKLTWNDIVSVAQKDQHMNFIAVLFI